MRIELMATSPTYGGGGLVDQVGSFLLEGLPDVGSAIERIEVDLLLVGLPQAPRPLTDEPEDSRPPDDPYADNPAWGSYHEEQRAKGPALTFRRQAGRVGVRVVSELSELDVFGSEHRAGAVSPERCVAVFAAAAREVVAALAPLRQRVKRDDDLDPGALLAHLERRLDALPGTPADLEATIDRLFAAERARWAAMTPWEVVDVDWSLYAPEARALLDDPFYWDPADEEAPHGNDTGADLLADYLDQRPDDILAFVADLEVGDEDADDDLVIAAAFAELKVLGRTHPAIRERAVRAVHRREPASEAPSEATRLLLAALG